MLHYFQVTAAMNKIKNQINYLTLFNDSAETQRSQPHSSINQAKTQIVLQKLGYNILEKEPDTIEENLTPSYDGNSSGKQVTANQVETERQDDSNEDTAETGQKGTGESCFGCTTQKGQHHISPEAKREQQRNNTGQNISSSIEAGKTIET